MPIEGVSITTPLQDSIAATIKKRARKEYGDYGQMLVEDHTLDGTTRLVDLKDDVIEPTGLTITLNGTALVAGQDYTLDPSGGRIALTSLPPANAALAVTGTNYQFYTDEELDDFLNSALLKHTHQRVVTGRSVDTQGFVAYSHMMQTLVTLPEIEYHPVALFTAIEALWTLAGDGVYDIDVNTADGTSLPRMQRYQGIMNLIASLTDRYKDLCFQIGGVGFWRIHDGGRLRRVSLSTGRLIPLRAPREMDDGAFPVRILTPIEVPAGTLTPANPASVAQYNPETIAGNTWTDTLNTDSSIDLTVSGTSVSAVILAGSRASAIVPIIVTVNSAHQVGLSLTSAVTATLPPYAPWRMYITLPNGNEVPAFAGTFLTESL